MAGKLYVVGTPIGNLSDMTFRGVETLESVDFIAAEDTRVTLKLLNSYEIKKPLVSYHQHSRSNVAQEIADRIMAGENGAIVTDAGMPCVSDPGEELVRVCVERGIIVEVVPAASAAVSALAVSGLPTARFAFEGFLSTVKKERREHLESLIHDRHTLIFYEAPHKLVGTLEDMKKALGDRRISLCRELTKMHEEIIRTTIGGAIEYYSGDKSPRGEYVLVVEGATDSDNAKLTIDEAVARAQSLIDGGMKPTEACKEVAKATGYSKGEIYSRLV